MSRNRSFHRFRPFFTLQNTDLWKLQWLCLACKSQRFRMSCWTKFDVINARTTKLACSLFGLSTRKCKSSQQLKSHSRSLELSQARCRVWLTPLPRKSCLMTTLCLGAFHEAHCLFWTSVLELWSKPIPQTPQVQCPVSKLQAFTQLCWGLVQGTKVLIRSSNKLSSGATLCTSLALKSFS